MVIELLIAGLLVYFLSYLIGRVYTEKKILSIINGFFTLTACLEVVGLLFFLIGGKLSSLAGIWASFSCLLAAVSLLLTRKKKIGERGRKVSVLFKVLVGLMILIQVSFSIFFTSSVDNYAKEIIWAVKSVEQDAVSVVGGGPAFVWWLWIASLSWLTGLHPMIIGKSLMPWIVVPLSYFSYGIFAKKMFNNEKKSILLFLFFIFILHLFSFQSEAMGGICLLAVPYGGKVAYVHIFLPYLFYRALTFEKTRESGKWILLPVVAGACISTGILGLTGVTLTGTGFLIFHWVNLYREQRKEEDEEDKEMKLGKNIIGIGRKKLFAFLAVLVLFMGGTVFAILKLNVKINTLYHAARDLEANFSSQVQLFELRQRGDGELTGYAMRLTDTTLVLINGGDETNEEYLHDFILERGGKVACWYITDKKHGGAYEAMAKAGYEDITIEEVVYGEGR